MFKELHIDKFRQFEDITINLGENITIIAGHNGTGKTTLLGLICNSCEEKSKKTITNKLFRSPFDELFKSSKEYDQKGTIGYITYSKDTNDTTKIYFRVAWQNLKDPNPRFRIIPKRKSNTKKGYTESKLPIPSIYMGLSRLYPIGEVESKKLKNIKLTPLNDEDREWVLDNYRKILSMNNLEIKDTSSVKFSNKIFTGINTNEYNYLTNSSGQDNLMQILNNLISFKILKENAKDNSNFTGILAIDEIECSLHPNAQIRLCSLLYDFSIENNIQIMFTTHSLNILKYFSKQSKNTYKLNKNNPNSVSISYITNANNIIEVKNNPNYTEMENDMNNETIYSKQLKKIHIFSEDKEARIFIEIILKKYEKFFKLLDINSGSSNLINFMKNEKEFFKDFLFILDGDVKENLDNYNNIITLPGKDSPEKILYEYLLNLPSTHKVLQNKSGVTLRTIEEFGPYSDRYKNLEHSRDKYKHWFNDQLCMIKDLNIIECWIDENPEIINDFINDFKNSFNIIASRNLIDKIEY